MELIERFADRWDWDEYGLSGNKALPWNLDLIERFEDQWDFDELIKIELPEWRILRPADVAQLLETQPW